MELIASTIVQGRMVVYILFAAMIVFCVLGLSKVQVNNDITAFLPSDIETRRGLTIMEDEFETFASIRAMVSNITLDKAHDLADELGEIDHVFSVSFDDTTAHYSSSSALFSISLDCTETDPAAEETLEAITDTLKDYDTYISTTIGYDVSAQIMNEMGGIIAIALIVIVLVMLFTSVSYFEVVICMICFGVSALLNMGTNYLLGEISSITNSVAIILQLALSIDYAIILCHRYQEEFENYGNTKDAITIALSKAIVEISSSSLTTISGLVALTLMKFRLGYDLGTVLIKGIFFSLITIFLLMPALIVLFHKPLEKTTHRSLVPNLKPWGNFLVKHKLIFSVIFLILIPIGIYCSGKCVYAFSDKTIVPIVKSERYIIDEKINSTFSDETTIAVLVPRGDYDSEKKILEESLALDNVSAVTGLANTEVEDGYTLTDLYTPRMFAELVNIDIEEALLLYQAYGVSKQDYTPIFNNAAEYKVPVVDMFLYLFDMMDEGIVNLTGENADKVTELRGTLEKALLQLRGENWSRLVITANVPIEGDESVALVAKIHEIADSCYEGQDTLVIGDITSARDLNETFSGDNTLVNALSIIFVYVILLFTFNSVTGALLLVFVIQGSIWINFSFPFITDTKISFIAYLIVSAIQMGATIDYAIVMMSRFNSLKETMTRKEAAAEAVKQSFATIFTSGSIMTTAGFLIAYMSTEVYISSIGLALGRGALISVILVLTALPQLIYLTDKLNTKTTFKVNLKLKEKKDEDNK